MKNLNRKGLTLTELIVSFAIVAVAVVYFYQTLYTVRKLYTTAQTETQEYVDKNYAIRVVDSYIDKYGTSNLNDLCSNYNLKYEGKGICKKIITSGSNPMKVTIEWGENSDKKNVSFNVNNNSPKEVPPLYLKSGQNKMGYDVKFLNSPLIKRREIKKIKFASTKDCPEDYNENDSWDISLKTNSGEVIAWYKGNSSDGYEITIGAEGKVSFPVNSSYLFQGCYQLEEIDFSNVNTRKVTNMANMFEDCIRLKELKNLSVFVTDNVTGMSNMFESCTALKDLDLSSFKTSNVKNMKEMFKDCSNLGTITFGDNFKTTEVKSMEGMFHGCGKLSTLNLKNFVTDKVENMVNMFSSCSGLTKVDLSSFDTSNVEKMNNMFYGCSGLTELNLSNFDTIAVSEMYQMFHGCSGLTKLDLSSFDTSNVKQMYNMFYNCSALTELDVSNFDTSNATSLGYMFYNCRSLKKLDISGFIINDGVSTNGMTYNVPESVIIR